MCFVSLTNGKPGVYSVSALPFVFTRKRARDSKPPPSPYEPSAQVLQARAELIRLREKQALEPAAGPNGSEVMHLLRLVSRPAPPAAATNTTGPDEAPQVRP